MLRIYEYLNATNNYHFRVFYMSNLIGSVALRDNFIELDITKNIDLDNDNVFTKMSVILNKEDIDQIIDAVDNNKEFVKQYHNDPGDSYYYFSVCMRDKGYVIELYVKKDGNIVGTMFSLTRDNIDTLLTALTGQSRRGDIEIVGREPAGD